MRWKWFVGIFAFLVLALMVAVYAVLVTYDYNKLKPRVAQLVKDATGRELYLGGEINLAIGFSPSLVVMDVELANTSWGSQPQMIEIEKLQVQVRLMPLLFKDVKLNKIGLFGLKVLLETGPDAQKNWDFLAGNSSVESTDAFKPTAIDVDQVNIENLHLTFFHHKTGAKKQFALANLAMSRQETEDVLKLKLRADYNGQPLTLSGKTGRIRHIFTHQRFPLQLSGKLASAEVRINGAIDHVLTLQGIDLETQLSGKNFATLGQVLEIRLPRTEAFDISGHLKGSGDSLGLDNIKGSLSGSSINIAINGSVGNLIAFSGVDLNLKSSGKDLAVIEPLIGEKFPATDQFEIQGRLTGSSKALTMKNAQATASHGGLQFAVNGMVKDFLTLRGMDLQSRLTGKNMEEFGEIIKVKLPATDEFAIQGRLNGTTEMLTLQEAQASARRGHMRLSVSGAVKDLLTLEGLDLQSRLTGKELAEIGPLFGAELPRLGPFDMSGRISGSAEAIALNGLSAIVDKSDFNGIVKVQFLKRPKWTVRLDSSVIDFTAFLEGFEKGEPKSANKNKQERRFIPDALLPFDVLREIDADILLKARNIHAKDARLEFGHLSLKLEEHALSIDKIEATYRKTKISGNLKIKAGTPSRVSINFLVQNFNLGEFLKETGKSDQVRATVDIAAHGNSEGDSVNSLMSNLNGAFGAVMGPGYLTKYLDMLSVDLSQKVIHFWGSHKKAEQIKCAVVQFDIKKGITDSRAFVFDTQAGILSGEGEINLGTEQINFLLVPTPKEPGIRLSTKLRVSGTIMDAKVSPDKLASIEKGALALSSLVVGPLGLLAPFVHLGAHNAHPCNIESIGQLGLQSPAPR